MPVRGLSPVLRRSLLSALAVLGGAACYFLSISMKCWPETVRVAEGKLFSFFLGPENGIPLVAVWFLPLVTALLLLVLSPSARGTFHFVTGSKRRVAGTGLAVLVFLFTLIPGKHDGQMMVAYLALAGTGFVLLLYGLYPLLRPLTRVLESVADLVLRRVSTAWFLVVVCGLCFVLTNLISCAVFRHIPHVSDSICYVFQGRVFASGRVWVPAAWDDYFFRFEGIVNDHGRMYAIVPFGHSLLLALSSLVRAEWLVNPLLGTLTLSVLYHLGKETGGETVGRLAALLGLFSPFLIFMSSEYMNHASALLLTSLFLLFFLRLTRTRRLLDAALAGAAMALLVNTRPLNALALAVPAAGFGLWLLLHTPRSALRNPLLPHFGIIAVGALLGLLLFLGYNWLLTGNPLLSGYQAYARLLLHQPNWGLGFGVRGPDTWGSHTPARGLIQTLTNLNALNRYLFESPFPGLLLVLLLFLGWGLSRDSRLGNPGLFPLSPADWLLLAVLLALPAAYFFYWYEDLCFGPRFLYETIAPALVLSSRGVLQLPGLAAGLSHFSAGTVPEFPLRKPGTVPSAGDCPLCADARQKARGFLLAGALLSLVTMLAINLPPLLRFYARDFWGVGTRIAEQVRRNKVNNAVVFIQSDFLYYGNVWDSYYGAGFLGNTLDFQGPVVYARDQGDENYLLMMNLPGRRYYYADSRSFYEIGNFDSLRALPKIAALAEARDFYYNRAMTDSQYRCLLVPFREVGAFFPPGDRPVFPPRKMGTVSSVPGPVLRTYTEVSNEIYLNGRTLNDYLPALAVFFPLEKRSYLSVFRNLAEPQNFIADGLRFTRVFSSANGICNVFDIRPATGREQVMPARSEGPGISH